MSQQIKNEFDIKKEYSDIKKEYSDIKKEYSDIIKEYSDINAKEGTCQLMEERKEENEMEVNCDFKLEIKEEPLRNESVEDDFELKSDVDLKEVPLGFEAESFTEEKKSTGKKLSIENCALGKVSTLDKLETFFGNPTSSINNSYSIDKYSNLGINQLVVIPVTTITTSDSRTNLNFLNAQSSSSGFSLFSSGHSVNTTCSSIQIKNINTSRISPLETCKMVSSSSNFNVSQHLSPFTKEEFNKTLVSPCDGITSISNMNDLEKEVRVAVHSRNTSQNFSKLMMPLTISPSSKFIKDGPKPQLDSFQASQNKEHDVSSDIKPEEIQSCHIIPNEHSLQHINGYSSLRINSNIEKTNPHQTIAFNHANENRLWCDPIKNGVTTMASSQETLSNNYSPLLSNNEKTMANQLTIPILEQCLKKCFRESQKQSLSKNDFSCFKNEINSAYGRISLKRSNQFVEIDLAGDSDSEMTDDKNCIDIDSEDESNSDHTSRQSNKALTNESSVEAQSERLDKDSEESESFNSGFQKKNGYKCDICAFKSKSYSYFVSHSLFHYYGKSDCCDITTNLDKSPDYSLSRIISMICNDKNEVNRNINLNSDTKLLKCAQCSFECSDKELLFEHLNSHSSEIKFICPKCNFEGSNESELDSHLSSHSTFKCSKCSYENSDVEAFNSHSCEASCKDFKCPICNFVTKKEKHFTLHSQIHSGILKCTECNFSSCKKDKFKNHLLSHLPKGLYTCSVCDYKTNYYRSFEVHLLNHTDKRLLNCTECDYKTNQKKNLQAHMKKHFEIKKCYKCSECDFSTCHSAAFKNHTLNHSGKKLFLCSECNYGTNYKGRMNIHALQHSSEKLYKCSKCDFGTNHKKNLKEHEARHHGGQYLHACNLCDYKCYKLSSLKRHSTVHSDTKLYKCPECSFECKSNLKIHIQNMHFQTKMYKCSECKYEGNHRSNFLTHIRTHSSERKYSCPKCSFSSKRSDNLKVHLSKHLEKKSSNAVSDLTNSVEESNDKT